MKLAPRESVLLLVTVGVGLYGATALVIRPQVDAWRECRQEQEKVREQIAQDEQVLADRERWQQEFQQLRQMLPQFPADKKMDVHWLSVMDEAARRQRVSITQRQAGEEKRVGDVYELPVECRDWEGTLEALTHFLFDLQAEGAMLDVRQLLVAPKEPRTENLLRGRFTLYCAYARESPASKE